MLTLMICVILAVTAVPPRHKAWALYVKSSDLLDATASTLNDLPEFSDLGKPDAWYAVTRFLPILAMAHQSRSLCCHCRRDMHADTGSSNSPQVLLVLDPNGLHCWEDVHIDIFINETLLSWLHNQSDALTVGKLPGTALPLQVSGYLVLFAIRRLLWHFASELKCEAEKPTCPVHSVHVAKEVKHGGSDLQLPTGLQGPRAAQTFAEMVEQAWQTQAASIKVPSQLLVAFQMTL